jgi:ferredoxin, 2Fe-2S
MPQLTFLFADGRRHELTAKTGISVMRAALDEGLGGVVAECGGVAACGTCHVFVDEATLARLPACDSNEASMLDYTAEPRASNSRLSCQIMVTDDLEGAVIRLPSRQI